MISNHTTPNKALLSVLVLAATLVATGAAATFVAQPATAQQYSIPTTIDQRQTCDTAGGSSPISTSCNGTSNNNVANSETKSPPVTPNPPPE